jgi:formate dehydrogenase iron-sulfur subunit
MSLAILTDTTRCTGCEKCVDACVEANKLGADVHYPWRERDGLSGTRFCSVLRLADHHHVRLQCRHCLEPACASVCPVGALVKTEQGPVVYDPDICMGCRYCMMACPYGIPRYEWQDAVPYIRKCTMCFEAITEGRLEQPACTAACPEHATEFFASREAAIAEARKRIAENPGRYFGDRIFGEHQVGGTGVLYLSDIDLDALGWPGHADLGDEPFPRATERILATVPGTFVGVCALMAGTFWVIRRRQEVALHEQLHGVEPRAGDGTRDRTDDGEGEGS